MKKIQNKFYSNLVIPGKYWLIGMIIIVVIIVAGGLAYTMQFRKINQLKTNISLETTHLNTPQNNTAVNYLSEGAPKTNSDIAESKDKLDEENTMEVSESALDDPLPIAAIEAMEKNKVVFNNTTPIVVSGTYEMPDQQAEKTLRWDKLCFTLDQATEDSLKNSLAPEVSKNLNSWFCFSNESEAKKMLGVTDCGRGEATIKIVNYVRWVVGDTYLGLADIEQVFSQKKTTTKCQ